MAILGKPPYRDRMRNKCPSPERDFSHENGSTSLGDLALFPGPGARRELMSAAMAERFAER
jgi:hypothetical protein